MPSADFYIAAIGASAGGLEALQMLISHIPPNIRNIAFIVVQHLSPTYKSMLVQTLSNQTKLEVIEVRNRMKISACNIYITPPDNEVSVKNGMLFLQKTRFNNYPHPSIDGLFMSVAAERKQKSIGVILSGNGTDGAAGVRAIKAAGGIVLVQNPKTARYNGMPIATVETGVADHILSPDKIAGEIALIASDTKRKAPHFSKAEINDRSYGEVITLLSRETGTDFNNYKQNTLYRRIDKRVAELKLDSVESYIKYITKNQSEIEALFGNVLIGVTNFFRDAPVFKALEKHLSALIDSKEENAPLRIWMPGCSTGEETYTLAMIIADILKKKKRILPVQIFGTDIDEHALGIARKAIYRNKSLLHVPADKVKDYFIKHSGYAEVSKTLRSMVLFSRHDLTHNPPFLKLDVIVCRNLLIYFNNRLQDYIFPVFYSALKPHGYLLLGKSEGIGHFTDLFTALHSDAKIYQRKGGAPLHNIRYTPLKPEEASKYKTPPSDFSITEMVKETLYKVFEHPYVVINDNADIKEISGDVSLYMGLKQGQMNANLFKLAHDDLKIELRSLINKCIKENTEARGNIKKFQTSGRAYGVKITVRPLLYAESPNEYYMVVFESAKIETSEKAKPATNGSDGNLSRIKELELELDATKEDLQTFVERLENTNNELQTVNEEAQSTNEELRISNEELETTNEELQSSNEEMNIAYAELKSANQGFEKQEKLLHKTEINVQALLNNTMQSFILIDHNYKIIAFNGQAAITFKTISGLGIEVGDNFEKLITRKEFAVFVADFKLALKGKPVLAERMLVDKQGETKTYLSNFTQIMDGNRVQSISFSMLDITEIINARAELKLREDLLTSVFETADIGIGIIDTAGKIIKANAGFGKLLGYAAKDMAGKSWFKLIARESMSEVKQAHVKTLQGHVSSLEHKAISKDGHLIDLFTTNKLQKASDGSMYIIKTVRDVTDTEKYKELLQHTESVANIAGFELDVLQNKVTWTKEMYRIHEVGKDYIPTLSELAGFFTRESTPKVKQTVEDSITKGKKFDVVAQMMTGKKNLKWVRISGHPVQVKSKTIKVVGFLQDITETTNNKLDLEKSQKLIETVFHSTDVGIAIVDAAGKVININDGYANLLGYERQELIGKVWYNLGKTASFRKSMKVLHDKTMNGTFISGERKAMCKDGTVIDVYATNKLMHSSDDNDFVIKTMRDITETKKFKDLLQLAEQLAKVGGFEIDAETRVTTWTDEMYHLFEVARDFVPTIEWTYNLYLKKDRSEAIKHIQDALHKGTPFEVVKQVKVHDKLKWVHIIGNTVRLPSNRFKLVGTVQDITTQKLAEEEILRLSYVASHTNSPVIITDARGKVEWANKSFEKLTGYGLDELKGKVPGHILQGPGTDKAAVKRISAKLGKKEGSTGEILLNYTKQGEPVWISTDITPIFKDGELINYVSIMTDLTEVLLTREIQRTQDVLLHKTELFNAISKYFPNGIIGIINQDLKYVYVGGTELKKLDLLHHNLIGDRIFDKIHDESSAFAEPFLKRAFLNEKVSFEVNISGNTYQIIAVPVKDKDVNGPITQALVVITNITQQKTTEEELRKAIDQQKELNELKSKFVSIASHEFRTPLSTILSSTYLLENYNVSVDGAKREKHLKRIKKSVTGLTDILNDFLTLGKIEEKGITNRPSVFNIRELFKEILDEVQGILKDGQQIKFHKKGEDDMVNLDKQHFSNIVLNLISNAIKYSPGGKTITVSVGYHNHHLEINVKDEGIGIPDEDQKRLFNTFYRAHNVTNIPGTGMGLHIVKKYLDSMGGTIDFTSQVNRGSTFTVKLKQADITQNTGA